MREKSTAKDVSQSVGAALDAALESKFGASCAGGWDANQKCTALQEVLVEVARAQEKPKEIQAEEPDNAQAEVKNAIKERKELKMQAGERRDTERIKELSKQI